MQHNFFHPKIKPSYYWLYSYKMRLLWVVSIIILTGILYVLLLHDNLITYEKSKNRYAQQLMRFQKKYQQYVNWQVMQQQLNVQTNLMRPEQITPYLMQLLEKMPIELTAIEPISVSKSQPHISLFKLSFQGSEQQIMYLLSYLPTLSILAVVTTLSITKKANALGLILTITLEVYHR